jgi:parallel beta-helix repeat protein
MRMKMGRKPSLPAGQKGKTTAIAEAMESRVLFSADLAAPALAISSHTDAVQQQSVPAPAVQTAPAQLFVVDLRIANVGQLLLGLESQQAESRAKGERFDILLLEAFDDGIAKTGEALSRQGSTSVLHLIGHGSDGMMLLGNSWIDESTIRSRAGEYSDWGQSLSDDADILLYGCDFAISETGKTIARSLADLTGADVSASIDTTSGVGQSGDWDLEYQVGTISATTQAVTDAAQQTNWQGQLATFVVTNENNSGSGSLRDAINSANLSAGADVIAFNIAGAGVHTINLASALPSIVDTVHIDGTTQSGYASAPLIELNGTSAGLSDGIQLFGGSSGSRIQGLIINRFGSVGINITSSNNSIAGNYIGTNSDGTASQSNGSHGIYIENSSGNLIGGSLPLFRNVIGGNGGSGIAIDGAGSTNNSILGNYVGTSALGLTAIANTGGIAILGTASYTVIGGSNAGEGNLVSGNAGNGIGLYNTRHNTVRGNIVGLSALGTSAIANQQSGIAFNNSSNDIIGGSGIGDRNTVSGNTESGIFVQNTNNLSILGNLIGRNALNSATIGNGYAGVLLDGVTTSVLVGNGTASGGNEIAGQAAGIATNAFVPSGNAFLANRIYGNSSLGIDLGADGVTLNDALDADAGSNGLQNFPLLYTANSANGNLTIKGELNSSPNTTYRAEFFASPAGNNVGYGEAATYLGSVIVSTNILGNGYFDTTFNGVTLPANQRVTSTATVDLGAGSFGSTSEFSRNVVSTVGTPHVTITPPVIAVTTEAGGTASFSVVLDSAPTSNVTINLSVSDPTEGSLAIGSLTFTPLNWNIAQVVTVTGVNDFLIDGTQTYSVITSAAVSADVAYNGLTVADVSLTTLDDDTFNTAVVNTTSDVSDGDVSSLAALYANRGADGKISLREAIFATNNTVASSGTVNHIHFDIQDSLVAGEHVITIGSSLPIVTRAVVMDATTDGDWTLNGGRPVIVLDGNDLSASGIEFSASGGGSTVRGFIVRNFAGNAILLTTGADGITIAGNYIGSLNAYGADAGASLTNGYSGIYIDSNNNIIGGTSVNDRNIVSGNLASAIVIHASSGNVVQNNFIGTNGSGASLVSSSSGNGVILLGGAANNQIGVAGFGNVIGGFLNGIAIRDAGSNFNKVQGNFIGTDLSGSINIGNIQEGVEVLFSANNNLIGGANLNEGNTIFNNGNGVHAGVSIEDTTTGNAILGNRISNSGAIGIQLGWASFAPLPNDVGDTDTGANGQQNYPVLVSAVSASGNTSIVGSLNSTANQTFRIEFFSSPTSDTLGFGEGKVFLDHVNVTTDAVGNAPISALLSGVSVASGYVVSATATVAQGAGVFGSTSEFAKNVVVSSVPPGVTVVPPTSNTTPEYGGTAQFSVVLNTPPTANVTINLSVSDPTEGSLAVSSITFTPLNWNIAQFVTVTGVSDFLLDGDINYQVITSATSSADPAYSSLTVADVGFVTIDFSSFNTVMVNTTSDVTDGDTSSIEGLYANRGADGKISLREAILAANATVNPGGNTDRIFFNIPDARVGGLHTIELNSALPSVTEAVYIDGTTEPDYLDTPVIQINNASLVANGITFANGSAGSDLQGLMITRFSNAGVLLDVGSDSTFVGRNYIGTNGIAALGNNFGIVVRSDISFIGKVGFGNLISGNTSSGIQIQNGANSNFVIGNKIGTNVDGTAAVANGRDGVEIVAGADNNVIGDLPAGGGNLISGNSRYGISVTTAQGTLIRNNYIGLTSTGNGYLGNAIHGISLQAGASGTVIGGVTAAERNVISGNTLHGIQIGGPTTANNAVFGNYIGTAATGAASIGNGWSGISIDGNAKNNLVGGALAGQGNVIAGGLGNGVTFSSSGTTGNKIQGNFIGTNSAGTQGLGNAYVGVEAVSNSGANLIGGTAAGEGNVIAFNGFQGVSITSGDGLAILGNQIYSNAGLGIDLGDDGVTVNDSALGDPDVGPNTLLNFPVFFSAEQQAGGYVSVGLTLDVPQLNSYRIEFYSSPVGTGDISQHGEARRYLGFIDVNVPATPTAYQLYHTFVPNVPIGVGDLITATATLKTSATTFAATSEFSENIALAAVANGSVLGRVFDDPNATGSIANPGLSGARVYLFLDNGDGVANASDTLIGSKTTDGSGNYSFTGLAAGTYWTVVDSRSITGVLNSGADASSVWWEQTYGAAGSKIDTGSVSYTATSGLLIGGARRDLSDGFSGSSVTLANAEHLVRTVVASGATITNIDFGFSSQLVTTTGDADNDLAATRYSQGSLRQFIQNSNAVSGIQTSQFRLVTTDAAYDVSTGTWRFNITQKLPSSIDGGIFDGYTQTLWGGNTNLGGYLPPADPLRPFAMASIDNPEIALVGSGAGANAPALSLSGVGGKVSGLAIYGFGTAVYTNANGATIESNFLGVTTQAGDTVSQRVGTGIAIDSASNTTVRNNLIAFTNLSGIAIQYSDSILITSNTITNTGLSGNQYDGINVIGNNTGLTINANSILMSNAYSIDLAGSIAPVITNNFIADSGLAGFELAGIRVGTSVQTASIQSNVITRSFTAISLQGNGVANAHQIGGIGLGNVLVGNQRYGIALDDTNGVTVQGNYIGVTAALNPLPNAQSGIYAASVISNTLIGGTGAGQGNVIANASTSLESGILLGSKGYTTTILGNSIYQNNGLGISYGLNGITPAPNDLNDADLTALIGPQNYPVISNVQTLGASTLVNGVLNSKAGRNYRIEVFRNPVALVEPNGVAEGAQYLGYFNVSTDASGRALFSQLVGATTASGDKITLTATEDFGTGFASTSEFSVSATVSTIAPGIVIGDLSSTTTSESGTSATFTVRLTTPPTNNVTINLSSSDTTEGVLSISSLTFTSSNWNIPQLVTVTGVDDTIVDGNKSFSILTGYALSADPAYAGLVSASAPVVISNTDNDSFNSIVVDTTSDSMDGDISSIEALQLNRGADGQISLREAIIATNNSANGASADRIRFNIAAPLITGAHTINLNSALPTITQSVEIDASTEPDFVINSSRPVVVINGNDLAADGLVLEATADASTIRGLVIRNFNGNAITIQIGSDGNTIAGNYLGSLNTQGTSAGVAESNSGNGLRIYGANNKIGGINLSDRNVISGNQTGIFLYGLTGGLNLIQGNYIGVDASAVGAVPNASGILIFSAGNLIGGIATGAGNLISGNSGQGILISNDSALTNADNNVIQGNSLVDNGAGIVISGSSNNLIGGATASSANVINKNSGACLAVFTSTGNGSLNNSVLRNQLSNNAGLAIDLQGDGVSLNDMTDIDTGANGIQNFPVLVSAVASATTVAISGTLNSEADKTYRIEFYASPTGAPSGYGQGQTYLGFTTVTTDSLGNASFAPLLTGVNVPVGSIISASATVDFGLGVYGSTSEFAKNIVASSAAPGITVSPPSSSVTTEASGTAQFSVVLNSQPTADVTIILSVSDPTEAYLSTTTLVFTAANWNIAQVVVVTGDDDSIIDGNIGYSVLIAAATSSDPAYNGLDASDISLSNLDLDTRNTFRVTNASDLINGDTSSIAALLANDGGDGISLREAITAANYTANGVGGVDQIFFDIGTGSPQTIYLNSALPVITDGVTIDASTQAGFVGAPIIELRGNISVAASGIFLMPGSDGSTIRGFILNNFGTNGVEILSNSNTVAGNYIGTNATGTAALSNAAGGFSIAGANNTIGGVTALDRNVIGGNNGFGILLYGAGANNNRIIGNYVGTNATGDAAIANNGEGIIIVANAHSNFIGEAGAGNVISGNSANGLGLNTTYGNIVQGNIIGLTADGLAALGNTYSGISVGDSNHNVIGGSGAGQRNVISGNLQNGIYLFNADSTSIQGNFIGRNSANTANLGNGGNGIAFDGISGNNLVGGDLANQGNVIAANAAGVSTSSASTVQVSIVGNLFIQNNSIAIDLGMDGVSANDINDTDLGPNSLLNFPVFLSAVSTAGNLNIAGSYNGTANTTFRVEFFGSPVGSVTQHGQAQSILGFTTITTDASGNATFYATLTGISPAIGSVVSATATVITGAGIYGSTSEFARNVVVNNAPPGITVSPPTISTTSEAGASSQFSVVLNAPPSADVTITLALSDSSEASLSASTLVFTSLNWNVAQVVTVTGVDDSFVDGSISYSVITSAAASADLAYNGLVVADVALSNLDNDNWNTIVVDTTADSADGDTSSISALYANKGSDGKISLREAILATNNTANGNQSDHLLFNIPDALIAGAHTINLQSGLPVITDPLFIDGASEPDFTSAPIVVINGAFAGAGVDGLSLGANGSLVNAVRIEGFSLYGIKVSGSNSAITNNEIINNVTGGVLIVGSQNSVSNNLIRNESVGVAVVGSAAGNTVNRNQMRNVGVLIDLNNDGLSANDIGDIDVGPNGLQNSPTLSSLTYTPFGDAQLAGIYNGQPNRTIVVDLYEHGTVGANVRSVYVTSFTMNTDVAGNATFSQRLVTNLPVGTIFSAVATDTTLPNDQNTSEHSATVVLQAATVIMPAVIVSYNNPLVVSEAGTTATVSFVLSTPPSVDVTINFNVSIAGEVSLSSSSITFTAANWNLPQILTITGLQDFVADGDTLLSVITSNVVSADASYSDLSVVDIAVTNLAIANIAPAIVTPVRYIALEDAAINLGGISSGLQITDLDAGSNRLSVTLSVSNGLYSLGTVAGLTFVNGDGTADASMTFLGTLAQLNAAIDTVQFIPNANFNGTSILSITVNDLGNTGTGGALSTTKNVPIRVAPVNDAATFSGSKVANITEGGSTQITSSMLQLSDVDTSTSELIFTVASQTSDGDLRRAGFVLRIGDSFTQADIDAGLIDYVHLGGENATASVSFSMTERFGAALPDVTLNFSVVAVNDAPTLNDLLGTSIAENSPVGTVVGAVSSFDPDNFSGAQFAIADPTASAFSIDSITGVVSVANPLLLNFEVSTVQSVRIKVTDVFGAATERVFQIQVTDVAEFAPVIPPTPTEPPTPPTPTIPPFVTVLPPTPPGATNNGTFDGVDSSGKTDTSLSMTSPFTSGISGIAAEIRANSASSLKQRRAELDSAIWIDPSSEASTSARKEILRRQLSSVELELLDADGFVKQRRTLNSDLLDALLGYKKSTSVFTPVNVRVYDFDLPADAKAGSIDATNLETSDTVKRFSVVVDSVQVGGVVLSVGVVAWVTRAGGLLAALMSALPAWKGLDPLLVLSPAKSKPDKGFEDFSDTNLREDEEAVQAVLS